MSALLDVSNPDAVEWLTDQLDALRSDVGIDGFKFDAGDVRDYRATDITARPLAPVEMSRQWASLGLRYPFNEFRACWKLGGQPLGQRLQDKPPSWDESGIASLIPEMLAQGMIGHPFVCPDMIGGGEIEAMTEQAQIDQEFFVRYTQIAVLSPMAQFSASPARVLDRAHFDAVTAALRIRTELLPLILDLVRRAADTGEPIMRPMAYHAAGMDEITDQFFLGPDVIVAPVVTRGARERTVAVPAGHWRTPAGQLVSGPATVTIEGELDSIPRLVREPDAGGTI